MVTLGGMTQANTSRQISKNAPQPCRGQGDEVSQCKRDRCCRILETLLIGLALAGAAALFVYMSRNRLIARDEGFYVMAAKLVLEGRTPYHDFFYPQMPLLPYVYAGWIAVAGASWPAVRLLSALMTTVLTLLLASEARRLFGAWAAILAVGLFAACSFVFPWYTTVQTYGFSTLLLFASYVSLNRALQVSRSGMGIGRPLVCGLLFGLAVDARLMFAGLLPIFAAAFVFGAVPRRIGVRAALVFCAGFCAAVLPNLYLALKDFDVYLYNNLGYHMTRSAHSVQAELEHKWVILKVLFGLSGTEKFDAYQMPILLLANAAAAVLALCRRCRFDPALALAGGLFLLNLTPSPTYMQYFSTLIPFLTIGALYAVQAALWNQRAKLRPVALLAAAALAAVYWPGVTTDVIRHTKTGDGVIGIMNRENARLWNVPRVRQIAEMVNRHLKGGDTVAAYWPGFFLETNAEILPGLENHFGLDAAARLDSRRAARYRLLSERSMNEAVRAGTPSGVLYFTIPKKSRVPYEALKEHYVRVETIPPAALYIKKPENSGNSGELQ